MNSDTNSVRDILNSIMDGTHKNRDISDISSNIVSDISDQLISDEMFWIDDPMILIEEGKLYI